METSDIKRLKKLEAENPKLKQMSAELSLKSQLQGDHKKDFRSEYSRAEFKSEKR